MRWIRSGAIVFFLIPTEKKTEQLAKLREKAANRKQKEKIATERKHKRLPQHS
jgi:hypothetical protein